ncbi:MAG: hypothetical protein ACOCWI_05400, partial [Bacillota bacterium]
VELVYRLNLSDDDNENNNSTQIKLRLPSNMQDMTNLVVLHFNEEGDYELIGAYREGEYIVFDANGMGDFVIMNPKDGISRTLTLVLFIAPVALFGLFVLFYMLFRRKYD